MNALKQMLQWPPTTSSVIGLGLIGAAVDYLLTGSLAQAMLIAGILKFVIPEDATAVDRLQQILAALKLPVVLVVAVGLGLAGCQGGAQQTGIDITQDVGAGIVRNISPAETAAIQAQCKAAAPALISATAATAPKPLKAVAVYPFAFCQQILSGKTVDPTQQSNQWLDNVLKMTATAAQIAGYVLPAVLPLL